MAIEKVAKNVIMGVLNVSGTAYEKSSLFSQHSVTAHGLNSTLGGEHLVLISLLTLLKLSQSSCSSYLGFIQCSPEILLHYIIEV